MHRNKVKCSAGAFERRWSMLTLHAMVQAEASNLTTAHNAALSDMLSTFNSSMANATVYEFDIYTAFNQLIMNAESVSLSFYILCLLWHIYMQRLLPG